MPHISGLFTTFIFRKPDHYEIGSMSTPSFTTEDRAHQESSDPLVDQFSDFADHSHDTPLDSRDPRPTYDGHFHGDPA